MLRVTSMVVAVAIAHGGGGGGTGTKLVLSVNFVKLRFVHHLKAE